MRQATKDYLRRYRSMRGRLALLVLASLTPSALGVGYVFILRRIFDQVLPGGDLAALNAWGAALVGLPLVSLGVTLWMRRAALNLTKSVIVELRRDLVTRLYELPRSFYTREDMGTLHARLVYDTERIDVMSNVMVAQFLPALASSAALTGVMLYLQWRLAIVLIAAAPLFFGINRTLKKAIEFRYGQFRASFEAMSRGLLFVVHSVDLTRSQTAEGFEVGRQTEGFARLRAAGTSLAWLDTVYGQIHGFLTLVITVIMLIVGGHAVAEQRMTLGALMAFFLAISLMGTHLRNLLGAIPQLLVGMKSFEALALLLENEEREPYSGTRCLERLGVVRLRDVHFRYRDDTPLLEGVDLEIRPAQRLAILGPNGCGKSTLLYLLAGFYRPSAGELTADHIPFEELSMADLRRRLAFVPQHVMLFNGTVHENIRYGLPDASQEDVQRAARWAMADEFIRELPEGYDTPVGDHGVRLSGGQRQRIALARALLREPELLALDEPTNHLDEQAVGDLMQHLSELPHRPAVVVISHERRVLRHVDAAWRLNAGRVEVMDLTREVVAQC